MMSAYNLQTPTGRRVYLLVGAHPHKRSNAAALVGIYCVLMLGMKPEVRGRSARLLRGHHIHVPALDSISTSVCW